MTNFVGDLGCGSAAHTRDLAIYDRLPQPIRDRLKISRDHLCAGCIRLMLRRSRLEATAAWLDHERTHRQAWARRGDRLLQI
jgi:hypothetical protein